MKRYTFFMGHIYGVLVLLLLTNTIAAQTIEVVYAGELQAPAAAQLAQTLRTHPLCLQSRISQTRHHLWTRWQPGAKMNATYLDSLLLHLGVATVCSYESASPNNSPSSYPEFKACMARQAANGKIASFNSCAAPLNVCDGQTITMAPWGPGSTITTWPNPPSNPEYDPFFGPASPWNNPWGGGTNYGCLESGELNSIWMRIQVTSPGNLEWAFLFPDFDGLNYIYMDWSLFHLTPSICADILANNSNAAPLRCNWNDFPESPIAATGMSTLATSIPIANEQDLFEVSFPVTAPNQYLLLMDNWSGGSFNGLMDFSLSSSSAGVCGVILPLGHTELVAEMHESDVELGWVNLDVEEYSAFEIQRAGSDGVFSRLRNLSPTEFYQTRHFVDAAPLQGISTYRIQRLDHNGAFSFSNVVSVDFENASFAIFPNPSSKNHFQVQLNMRASSLSLKDAKGQILLQQDLSSQPIGTFEIKTALAAGIYLLEIVDAQGRRSHQKLLLQ
jgi:hypothetical protein